MNWYQGTGSRYEVRVGEVRWLDQGQYHGRAPVEIRDLVTGEILKRMGDVKIIGNFSPIWVNVYGKRISIEHIAKFNRTIPEELEDWDQMDTFLKHGVTNKGPHDWLPKPRSRRKGRSMSGSMGASWGAGPFDSDEANRFLSGTQERIAEEIGRRIEPGTSAADEEILAAAGLLNYLTTDLPGPTGEQAPLDLAARAQQLGLFALAVAALDRILSGAGLSDRKHAAVRALRDELEAKVLV
jgi:hypothetical protein